MVIRTRACFLAGGKLCQLFFPHFSSILLKTAEPTQVDGYRRGRSRYAGVRIQPYRKSGQGPAKARVQSLQRKARPPSHGAGATRIRT